LNFRPYHDFVFFKTAVATTLDFRNSEILLADGVRKAEAHHLAKFRQNPPIHCGLIGIHRFFKMAAVRYLEFVGA